LILWEPFPETAISISRGAGTPISDVLTVKQFSRQN
jgi:hypothetical protein